MRVARYGALIVGVSIMTGCPCPDGEGVLMTFDAEALPPNMTQNNVEAEIVAHKGRRAMAVHFQKVDWPNVFFTPLVGATWDWSEHAGVLAEIYNPEDKPVDVCMRVDNEGGDGANHCNTGHTSVPAHGSAALQVRFNTGDGDVLWGMRGVPERGPVGSGSVIDPSVITAFQVFLPRPGEPHTLILKQVRFFGAGGSVEDLVPLPFVNRFGQYMHAKWPGKLKDERALAKRQKKEERALRATPALPGRDRFGGWADGPRLEATGWFRTEQVDGKWWLVTPDGHLFFSNGVDCVGTWEKTFIEGRDGWFEWLPDSEDPPYADMFGYQRGAHNMAEAIGGEGRVFSFYRLNLWRKYGEAWPDAWREMTYRRLRAWGFNTIANWSQEDVLANSPMPFVASTGLWGDMREIEGASGYWGRMKDVFDPGFAQAVERCIAPPVQKHAGNPLCIGYFVDNELSWETVRRGTLASPPDQPCRVALVDRLKAKYGTLAKLNEAWGTDAGDWDGLRVPRHTTEACDADLDAFEYAFALQYFETINTAIKHHAPAQLYLGCRFSGAPRQTVRACAEVVDVVSYNLYRRTIDCGRWAGEDDLGKPIIIGEFHFGALDRGMFHTGLVPTENQRDRAEHYVNYVRSVVDCPAFVGCHWFQFIDESITGRWFDGENYNIGFLDVTDTPYPELVRAAKKVHAEVYERRYRGSR